MPSVYVATSCPQTLTDLGRSMRTWPEVDLVGRPERPLDPNEGPVQAFALELRQLRKAAGRQYRALAARTGKSQTALSEAAGGKQLPTWETVEAFVRGCGGDVDTWRDRYEKVQTAVRGA